ncbi:FecCD family ABC transporter permease [Streptococcus dentiloxodontae]
MTSNHDIKKIFALLGLLVLVLFVLSLSLGYSSKSLLDVLSVFTGKASQSTNFIITKIRLPRAMACIIGGASLAMSGVLLQTLTRNPLADSGILGINTGAGLIVAIAVSFFDLSNPVIIAVLPFLAMVGGGGTILLVYLIARKKNHGISPTRLIITGVGVSTMLSGIMVSLTSKMDDNKIEYITNWLSGKITGDDWTVISLLAPLMIITWGMTYSRSQQLNIMNLNEQTALALGLNLQKERLITLMLSTVLAAFSVVIIGNITFVGLVAGHISRRYLGSNHRILLPASMLCGTAMLLLADTIGRVLLVGTGIPTGLIVSVIGAPYFLYLMTKIQQ